MTPSVSTIGDVDLGSRGTGIGGDPRSDVAGEYAGSVSVPTQVPWHLVESGDLGDADLATGELLANPEITELVRAELLLLLVVIALVAGDVDRARAALRVAQLDVESDDLALSYALVAVIAGHAAVHVNLAPGGAAAGAVAVDERAGHGDGAGQSDGVGHGELAGHGGADPVGVHVLEQIARGTELALRDPSAAEAGRRWSLALLIALNRVHGRGDVARQLWRRLESSVGDSDQSWLDSVRRIAESSWPART